MARHCLETNADTQGGSSEGSQYDRRVVRPKLLTQVGDEKGEGNVEGEQVVTESYIFMREASLEDREWDFAEFKREKLRRWTRAGYVFEGKCYAQPSAYRP